MRLFYTRVRKLTLPTFGTLLLNGGATQANIYLEKLDLGFHQLAKNCKLGKPCEEMRASYRCLHLNRHIIYYRLSAPQIIIVRVLHERMDTSQHLDD